MAFHMLKRFFKSEFGKNFFHIWFTPLKLVLFKNQLDDPQGSQLIQIFPSLEHPVYCIPKPYTLIVFFSPTKTDFYVNGCSLCKASITYLGN